MLFGESSRTRSSECRVKAHCCLLQMSPPKRACTHICWAWEAKGDMPQTPSGYRGTQPGGLACFASSTLAKKLSPFQRESVVQLSRTCVTKEGAFCPLHKWTVSLSMAHVPCTFLSRSSWQRYIRESLVSFRLGGTGQGLELLLLRGPVPRVASLEGG